MSTVQRVQYLRNILNLYNYQYYILNSPTVEDAVYDQLYGELVRLEKINPALIIPESPTQIVGSGAILDNRFTKVTRALPMLSIENIFDPEVGVRNFIQKYKSFIGEGGLYLEPKIDGLGIELLYVDGVLTRATTRGDGTIGEDVTANAIATDDIPNTLKGQQGLLEVRGEVFMNKTTLVRLNKIRAEKGLKLLANCRNAAAGAFKQLDAKVTRESTLRFFCYGFGRGINPHIIKTQKDFLDLISKYNIRLDSLSIRVTTAEEVVERFNTLLEYREEIPYEIDGLVIKINSLKAQDQAGSTSKYPRGLVALKFPADEGITTLKSVLLQVGRTGVITPLAVLDSIELNGVNVQKATLHNWDEIDRKDIRIGDKVIVKRAGDVIPAIVSSIKEERNGSEVLIGPPIVCPVCKEDVIIDEAAYRCVNDKCVERLKRSLHHFVSRTAFNISGLGKSTLNNLVDAHIVQKLEDVLTLRSADLLQLPLIGNRKTFKILDAIELACMNCTEERFLYSLGLRHIGNDVSKLLIKGFRTVEEVFLAHHDTLLGIDGIGGVMAESIIQAGQSKTITDTIKKIREKIGTTEDVVEDTPISQVLDGCIIVVTGTFELPRNDIKKLLESHGAKITSSVSKKTTYVLAGDKPGANKINKVQEPTKIIGEDDIVKLLT